MESEEGKVPEVDLRRFDHITSLITTYEKPDLKASSVMNYYYNKKDDLVFVESIADVNRRRVLDNIMGFDREKIIQVAKNLLNFFGEKN